MTETRLMDGTRLAADITDDVRVRAGTVARQLGRPPCLVTVLIGDDHASVTYVRMKQNRCRSAGIESRVVRLAADTSTSEAVATVDRLSGDAEVDGILVQHPAPRHVDERAVFEAIEPSKDVDGVTYVSFAAMALGGTGFDACTPGGIIRLLDHYRVELEGAHVVILGRSPILGKPTGMLLLARNATVTYCHSRSRDLPLHVATADIVVAAVGIPSFVRGEWLRRGSVVVDAGYNADNVGDVDFNEAIEKARLITPVPGGVGPMTIATLLDQTVQAAEARTAGTSPASPN